MTAWSDAFGARECVIIGDPILRISLSDMPAVDCLKRLGGRDCIERVMDDTRRREALLVIPFYLHDGLCAPCVETLAAIFVARRLARDAGTTWP